MNNLHTIESFTDKNKKYIVRERSNGEISCSCAWSIFDERKKQVCIHITKFLEERKKV